MKNSLLAVVLIIVLLGLPPGPGRAQEPGEVPAPGTPPACPPGPLSPGDRPVTGQLWDLPLRPAQYQAADTSSRVWNGHDPFHQPFATTDSHGSGDVDGDGSLTQADLEALEEILAELRPETHRADVDGSGAIDGTDLSLLEAALGGEILPGWWDRLSARAEREAWVDRFIALDRTESHTWDYWYQCLSFAVQLMVRGAGYEGSLFPNVYYGGQKTFNIPVYYVSVSAPGYGHGINGILVGDDPLDFADWRFIEPQTDAAVRPGDWDMPEGARITMMTPDFLAQGGFNSINHLTFEVWSDHWNLVEVDPGFIRTRMEPPARPADNRENTWRPIVLAGPPDRILFERTSDRLAPQDELFLADISPAGITNERRLALPAREYAHLLDAAAGLRGTLHLLIDGKAENLYPAVFYAKINPTSGAVLEWTKISSQNVDPQAGRILVKPNGEVHVFWYDSKMNYYDSVPAGIYWARRTSAGWQPVEPVTPEVPERFFNPVWSIYDHDLNNFMFDAEVGPDGTVYLLYSTKMMSTEQPFTQAVYLRTFKSAWSDPAAVGSPPISAYGISAAFRGDGTLHLVGWDSPEFQPFRGVRGNLFALEYRDGVWGPVSEIDGSGKAGYASATFNRVGDLIVTWEREVDEQIRPVYNIRLDGEWQGEQVVPLEAGWDAWYPRAALAPDGQILIYWSAQSPEWVTTGWTAAADRPGERLYLPLVVK